MQVSLTKEGMGYGTMAIIAFIVLCVLCSCSLASYVAYNKLKA